MKCSKCNTEYTQGQKFCKKCGAKLDEQGVVDQKSTIEGEQVQGPEVVQETRIVPEKENLTVPTNTNQTNISTNKTKSKGILKYVIGVAALVVIVLICTMLFKGSGRSGEIKNNWYSFTNDSGETIYINGKTNKQIVIDDTVYIECSGFYNNKILITDGEELYIVNEKGKEKIASDVIQAIMSARENKVFYITDYTEDSDIEMYTGDLYVYDINSKKSKKIDSEVVTSYYVSLMCSSPNGNAVSYVKNMDYDNEYFDVYVSVNGKNGEKVGKSSLYLGLSDDGKITYYVELDDETIYATNNGDKLKVSSNFNYVFFNKDASRALISDGESTYFIEKGKDKEKISGEIDAIVDAQYRYLSYALNSSIYYTDVDSFVNHIYCTSEGDWIKVDKNYNTTNLDEIDASYWEVYYAIDANKLYYVEDDSIICVDCSKPDKKQVLLEDGDVYRIYVTSNGKHIYYVNNEDELYYLKDKKGIKVANDVNYNILLTENGTIYYLDEEYEAQMYYSNAGDKKAKVDNSEETVYFTMAGDKIYYIVNDEDSETGYALYMVTKNGKSEKITDNIVY